MGLEAIDVGWLAILPPIIAIVLALITKEVFSSLILGIFSGMLIYCLKTGNSIIFAVKCVLDMMAHQIGGHGYMILFLCLLGSLVAVVNMAGGSKAYGKWAAKKFKSQMSAKLATMILGILIFIDDYFNCLTVGTVMRPITDKHKISREKLAYLIDATAAPVCIIAPISSWAVAVSSKFDDGGLTTFMKTIPFNLYAILTLVMVFVICVTKFDFGLMKKAEEEAANKEIADDESEEQEDGTKVSPNGKVYDLIVPILALIVFSILGMAYVGDFFKGVDFATAIGADSTAGLSLGAAGALLVAMIMYIPRKLVKFTDFMEGIAEGAKTMISAVMILVFAWSLSGMCEDMLMTDIFVSGLVGDNVSLSLMPAIVFLIAAFLSFAMGTAWGTFAILIPIVTPICTGTAILIPALGATLAGSVYGDHCSPISDTTILSSAGAKCVHIRHVETQMPYATLVAAVCFVGYIIAGITTNPWITLAVSVAILLVVLAIINMLQKKKEN